MCVSGQGTNDEVLGMIWITIWIQDPDYIPDHMDWWHSIFDVMVWDTTL